MTERPRAVARTGSAGRTAGRRRSRPAEDAQLGLAGGCDGTSTPVAARTRARARGAAWPHLGRLWDPSAGGQW
jgi:hypothetical protein